MIMKKQCWNTIGTMICLVGCMLLPAMATPIHVDFDMSGRPTTEVTEPGYTAWVVTEATSALTTISGVTFTVSKSGSAGTGVKTDWYKAAIQIPNYARLVGDGLTVVSGDAGGAIQMTIAGLSAGAHSLLTYHNTTNGYQHAEVSVAVNGKTVVTNLVQTNRALSTADAANSYVTFSVTAGQTVTVLYSANTSSSSAYKNVMINGFGLDVPNAANQADSPIPGDRDYHVDADGGSATLLWTAAASAKSHNIYFGTDSLTVATATTSNAYYQGNQTTTTKTVNGLNSRTVYFWRVDEVDANGLVTQGNVWSMQPRQLAFPGAEGYGRFARGGRYGVVVHVTNLSDAGAGSLREAVENDIGPRTIVFDVGGIIVLQSRLTLASSRVTIAGQTAPGKGICIRSAPFGFSGVSDGIMRFVRIRLGAGATFDGTGLQGSDHCIFDHNSVSWTIDESFSSRSGKNITLQRTMLAEALNIAGHQNYPAGTMHGYAASISGDVGSFHHNLLAHNDGRNWSLAGGLDANGNYSGKLDIFNNVVYNWNDRTTDGGAHQVNFVNNYYKPGAASRLYWALSNQWDGFPGTQQYYCHGNFVKGHYEDTTISNNGCTSSTAGNAGVVNPNPWVYAPFFPSNATVQTAAESYKSVLSDVGATMPLFDSHDQRIIKETLSGTFTYTGSVSGLGGLPDNESDVGGYESYPAVARAAGFDSDGDGMPDWWEKAMGLSPTSGAGSFTESNADADNDGYTNLEEYLNWMANPGASTTTGTAVSFNMASLTRGYENAPKFTVTATTCATTTVVSDSLLSITPNGTCAVFNVNFQVKDGANATMTRTVGVYVSDAGTVTQAPQLIKHGAGGSNQQITQGDALAAFSYSWLYATTVTVSGLPAGISGVIDNAAQTISFSGTSTADTGSFTFTIATVGGSSVVTRTGVLKIVPVAQTNTAPTITSANEFNVAENTVYTTAIMTASAKDAEGDALTYSLGGTDAAQFLLSANTRALYFAKTPDFEAPLDANADNIYNLILSVSDGVLTTTQNLNVIVTDVVEAASSSSVASSSSSSAASSSSLGGSSSSDPTSTLYPLTSTLSSPAYYRVFDLLGRPVLQSSAWPQKLGAGRWIVRAYGSAGQVLGSWVIGSISQ